MLDFAGFVEGEDVSDLDNKPVISYNEDLGTKMVTRTCGEELAAIGILASLLGKKFLAKRK